MGQSDKVRAEQIVRFWNRVTKVAKKKVCPACHNDKDLKKNCIVCRKSGFVWE